MLFECVTLSHASYSVVIRIIYVLTGRILIIEDLISGNQSAAARERSRTPPPASSRWDRWDAGVLENMESTATAIAETDARWAREGRR